MTTGTAIDGRMAGWNPARRFDPRDGSAGHPHLRRLVDAAAISAVVQRDLCDVVHAICTVHGGQPGMADDALLRGGAGEASWLEEVAQGFAVERAYLIQLAAAAGPLPSTPGQASTEAALVGQRHALSMLARSERGGCAAGAVVALVADWRAIRTVLDRAADRFDVMPPSLALPYDVPPLAAGTDRAIAFGAQQLLTQHRGLWDLLEARASARG